MRTVRNRIWDARRNIGDHVDIGFLLYQRGVFETYDALSKNDASPVMQALHETFPDARFLVDVGAGTGRFVASGRSIGLDVTGLERSRVARKIAKKHGVPLRAFDLRFNPKPIRCDLVFSFEVAEHIPARLAARFVRFIAACSQTVVLTAASPGQGGIGHINEQPAAYWEGLFEAKVAYSRDEDAETGLRRRLAREHLSEHWRVTNLFVFTPRGDMRESALSEEANEVA